VLDSSLDRPLYRQLTDRLRQEVARRRPGERIASEPELAHDLGISRFTVAKAIGALVGEGLLVRRQGKGTFVAAPPLQRTPVGLRSFTEAVRATGRHASSTLLDFRAAAWSPEAGYPPGEALFLLERLRWVDGQPMALHRSLLAASLVARTGLTRAVAAAADFSLYEFLAANGLPIERGIESLSARRATAVERGHLRLPMLGVVMVVVRRSFAADGRLLDAVEAVHDSRRYSYQALLQRDPPAASGGPHIGMGGRLT
jgi:GntR family transcriptional regulator